MVYVDHTSSYIFGLRHDGRYDGLGMCLNDGHIKWI
jgi:hypothetical protein